MCEKMINQYREEQQKNKNIDDIHNWATTRQNVSSGVSDQARHKPACAATEAS